MLIETRRPYMCPHTPIYVSYVCPLPLYMCRIRVRIPLYVPSCHYIGVRIPLYMCPHTTTCASSHRYICVLIPLYRQSACMHIERSRGPLYVCPHTTVYLSSYYYIRVRIPRYMCPHTTTYVSSYHYMCPHTTT